MISLALILGVAFGKISNWGLLFLLVTWIPDIPIMGMFLSLFEKKRRKK